MTATNHALTGATIGLLINKPLITLPVAFLSHFLCDAIPHFGATKNSKLASLSSSAFKRLLAVDASLCMVLVIVLFGLHEHHWLQASLCAFLATSPDLLWIKKYQKAQGHKKWRPSPYSKFASAIQWFEKPIGAFVELAWAIAAIAVISAVIRY